MHQLPTSERNAANSATGKWQNSFNIPGSGIFASRICEAKMPLESRQLVRFIG